nr:DNA-directed RNA polymerase subunit delta [Virgibacillus litoralis]
MIELAYLILTDKKKAQDFYGVYDKVAELKGFTEKQKSENIAQFHTNLTVDGRFMAVHTDNWGLKRWYLVEETDEEVAAAPKKKKKAKAKPKPKKKKVAKKEELKEEEEEIPADNIEVLTGDFKETGDDGEEKDEAFDESFDDESDDFDEDLDEFDEEDDDSDEEDDEEEKK